MTNEEGERQRHKVSASQREPAAASNWEAARTLSSLSFSSPLAQDFPSRFTAVHAVFHDRERKGISRTVVHTFEIHILGPLSCVFARRRPGVPARLF